MPKLYTIVDRDDNIVGYKTKSEATNQDILRVAGILIYNSNKEVLLAQRASTKTRNAGKWGMSAAGAVEKGETYIQNIIKETKEEIGIDIDKKTLVPAFKILVDHGYFFFYQQFFYKADVLTDDLKLEPKEVQQVRWFTYDNLVKEEKKNPDLFLIKTVHIVKQLLEEYLKE